MTVNVHLKDGSTIVLLHVRTVKDLRNRLEGIGVGRIKMLDEGREKPATTGES